LGRVIDVSCGRGADGGLCSSPHSNNCKRVTSSCVQRLFRAVQYMS
jgi:hypothetical protein